MKENSGNENQDSQTNINDHLNAGQNQSITEQFQTVLYEISSKSTNFKFTKGIGVLFFNDRFVIHIPVFCRFVEWNEKDIYSLLINEKFKPSYLSKDQFLNLAGKNLLSGSRFDLKVCCYYYDMLGERILKNVRSNIECNVSFFLFTANSISLVKGPQFEEPKMVFYKESFATRVKFPFKIQVRLQKEISEKEIFTLYKETENDSKKCWLLYKESDDS